MPAAELRLHPQVVGAIDRLWTAITGYGKFREYTGFIDREQYVLLSVQVSRNALAPQKAVSARDSTVDQRCFEATIILACRCPFRFRRL